MPVNCKTNYLEYVRLSVRMQQQHKLVITKRVKIVLLRPGPSNDCSNDCLQLWLSQNNVVCMVKKCMYTQRVTLGPYVKIRTNEKLWQISKHLTNADEKTYAYCICENYWNFKGQSTCRTRIQDQLAQNTSIQKYEQHHISIWKLIHTHIIMCSFCSHLFRCLMLRHAYAHYHIMNTWHTAHACVVSEHIR